MTLKTHEMVVFFEAIGGLHMHLNIFTGKVGMQRGNAGHIVMTNDEFEAWLNGEMAIVFKPKE